MSARAAGALEAVTAAVARRRRLEGALRRTLEGEGYREVAVPLLQPAGLATDWEAWRVLDQDGAVLDLRPDVTGPVARLCAVGDAGGPRPRRLWYLAGIFRRVPGVGPREIVQAGAERIGGSDDPAGRVTADAEVLSLAVRCLRAAGATTLRLAIGNTAYARERLRSAGLAPEPALEALRRRDFVALVQSCPDAGLRHEFGWRGTVAEALRGGLGGDGPAAAEWRALLSAVAEEGLADLVLVEPGLVLQGAYYTGMVFEALLPGLPAPVGDGGRYDGLLARWGSDEPAVGFALDADRLVAAVDGEAPAEGARRAWAAVRVPAAGAADGGRP